MEQKLFSINFDDTKEDQIILDQSDKHKLNIINIKEEEGLFQQLAKELILRDERKKYIGEDILSNINVCQNTLPGLIIFFMMKNGKPISENEIYEFIYPKLENLRKTDGGKYKGNYSKIIKSCLCASGVFYKENDGYWLNEKEAVTYLVRTTERRMSKISEKDKIFLINKKKKRLIKTKLTNINLKVLQVKNVLDEMLQTSKNNKECKNKLKSVFNRVTSVPELLKKIGDDDSKLIGILLCYKFFKPLINKVINRISCKKDSMVEIDNFKDKFNYIQSQVENMAKLFANNLEQ